MRILVVEDLPDAADTLAQVLQFWGYKPTVVYGGKQAIQLSSELNPDVVLLDIGLPGISGYEVARQLRQSPATASTLIVAITGHGRPEDIRRCKEAGIDLHFLKPVEPNEIRRVLISTAARLSRLSFAVAP